MYYLIGFMAQTDKGAGIVDSFVIKNTEYPSYISLREHAKNIAAVDKFKIFRVLAISKMSYQDYMTYQITNPNIKLNHNKKSNGSK